MDLDPGILIDGYLDDQLGEEHLRALNDWIKRDPSHARRLAMAVLQHDRLRDQSRAIEIAGDDSLRYAAAIPAEWRPRRSWPRRVMLMAIVGGLLAAGLLLLQGVSQQPVDAAEVELARLIESAGKAGDRTYRITSLDGGGSRDPESTTPRDHPPIEGAVLHVRGHGQYVLVRRPGEVGAYVTGSNGREAWAIPPDGPVHVSPDPTRFRGAVPGEQQDLPFLDLETALGHLRRAYVLELAPADPDEAGRRLLARKRSSWYRGPRDVEIHFDDRTGVIRRMRLDGLPQGHGGPRSVAFELVDRRDLGPGFFEHGSHHDPGRAVRREVR